jgi:hypothetical protein
MIFMNREHKAGFLNAVQVLVWAHSLKAITVRNIRGIQMSLPGQELIFIGLLSWKYYSIKTCASTINSHSGTA